VSRWIAIPLGPPSILFAALIARNPLSEPTTHCPPGSRDHCVLPSSFVGAKTLKQFAPAFARISPNHKIPAIVDPDGPGGAPISVFESGAILIYLAEKTGRFWPREPTAHVATMEWLMFQMGGFGPMPGLDD